MLTAAELLLAGSTVAAAAVRLGINPRTIFRWLQQPRFRAEIDRRADLAQRFRRAHSATMVAKRQEMSRNVAVGR
jgi:transposase-like protein